MTFEWLVDEGPGQDYGALDPRSWVKGSYPFESDIGPQK